MELLRDEQPVRVEVRFKRKSGEWVETQISATPLRDGAPRLTGWLAIGRDTSAQHRAHERTCETLARLEHVLDASKDGARSAISRPGTAREVDAKGGS